MSESDKIYFEEELEFLKVFESEFLVKQKNINVLNDLLESSSIILNY